MEAAVRGRGVRAVSLGGDTDTVPARVRWPGVLGIVSLPPRWLACLEGAETSRPSFARLDQGGAVNQGSRYFRLGGVQRRASAPFAGSSGVPITVDTI